MPNSATTIAHPNLAFIKYWGKTDSELNIPTNNSISMNLSGVKTKTTVELDDSLQVDEYYVNGTEVNRETGFGGRIKTHIDRIRALANVSYPVRVLTENSVPASVGFASSASGFAALSLACTKVFGIDLDEKDLSILARQGSGSACRSIPSGFVEWNAGSTNEDSYSYQLAPPTHWDLVDVAVVVSSEEKEVSSSLGHQLAAQSPFWHARLETLPKRIIQVRDALLKRDFQTFGQEIELEAISFHAVALTSPYKLDTTWHSGIYYWDSETLELVKSVQLWREHGLKVYFSLDAGPTVHMICESHSLDNVMEAIVGQKGNRNWSIITNFPAQGAHLIEK